MSTPLGKLTLRQERIALRLLAELARGERPFVGFRVTKSGALHEVASETFIEREAKRRPKSSKNPA